jgi:anthranilate phosphoribosyltransferase
VTLDLRPYLKELARGRHGARDLTREQARTVFAAVLAGEVDDLSLGALLVALRVKNESLDELAGMMDALAPHVRPLKLPRRRACTAVLPTYNGARKLPNLVPLLALLLAREGVPVLLHGVAQEPQRVSTFEILAALGHATASSIDAAENALEDHNLAAVPLEVLSPDLARLVDRRLTLGVRNSGHTLAKLLLPTGVTPDQALRLVAVTHPDFQVLLRQYFSLVPANVLLMRGVEGEPVVRLHAPQPIEQVDLEGRIVTHLLPEAVAPELPAREAAATAQWTRDVLEGQREVPQAIARQVALVAAACRHAPSERPALRLVT